MPPKRGSRAGGGGLATGTAKANAALSGAMAVGEGGVPSSPLEAERPTLTALKEALKADLAAQPTGWVELTGDVRLLRFLRGYDGNVEAAAGAYRSMLAWRKAEGMDAVREDIVTHDLQLRWADFPRGEEVAELFPMVLDAGWSKDGHLVQCDHTGLINMDAIAELGLDVLLGAWKYMLEKRNLIQDERSRSTGRMVQTVLVKDMSAIGMHMMTKRNLEVMKVLAGPAQDNYPETLARILFFHAPSYMRVIMTLVRPILRAKTISKFMVLGANYKVELLQLVEVDVLRSLTTLEDAFTNPNKTASGKDKAGELYVGARHKAEVPVVVACGTVVRWTWTVASYDIGFELGLVDSTGTRQLLPSKNVASGAAETGEYSATEEGLITFTWDNTHSRLRSKTVTYKIDVTAAAGAGLEPEVETS